MEKVGLSKLTLRDMALLVAIVEQKRIGPVSEKFNLAPATVSHALDRLRDALGDTLLVRQSHGFRPTQKAIEYAGIFENFLGSLKDHQNKEDIGAFQQKTNITLLCSDYEMQLGLSSLINRLLQQYPNLSVSIRNIVGHTDPSDLHDKIDLAIAPLCPSIAGISCTPLFQDKYMTFYDPNFRSKPATIKDFCTSGHVIMSDRLETNTVVDRILSSLGLQRNIRAIVPSFSDLAQTLQGGPFIATLPSRLKEGALSNLSYVQPPFDMPPLDVFLLQSEVKTANAELRLVAQEVQAMFGTQNNV